MREFPPFRLDTVNQCLWRGDGLAEERILLAPKAFPCCGISSSIPGDWWRTLSWPWASTDRRKGSRPHHATASRADRRRLLRSFGAGRGRAHTGRPARPDAIRTHTLSGAPDTSGGDSADGDGRQARSDQTAAVLGSRSPCRAAAASLRPLRLSVPLLRLPSPLIRGSRRPILLLSA